ncbi:hypothetical protein D3C75_1320300 [compost metagenome]
MIKEGNGASGIVLIQQSNGIEHAINVVNRNGSIYYIDSQMGKIVELNPNSVLKLGLP